MSRLAAVEHERGLQKISRKSRRLPRLYAIATKPTTPGQQSTAEWSLDLWIPPVMATESGLTSQDETVSSSPPSVSSTEVEEEQHYHFSRFNPMSYAQEIPASIIARISLSAVPSGAESPSESIELVNQIVEGLEGVHMTPDSESWLRQALFALQKKEILPAVTSGFAVNQFLSFAITHLQQQIQTPSGQSSEIKYSKVLREREGLRRTTVGSESAPRNIPTARQDSHDDLDNDEYEWSLPYRGKQARDGQTWNGFRSTGGSTSSSRSSSRARGISEPRRPRDLNGASIPAQSIVL